MQGIKKAGNLVEAKAAVRYVTSIVKTMIPAVVAGVLKPKEWRLNEGRKSRRDMQTQQALWLVVVGIGDKGKSLLNRASSAEGPQTMMESRRG